MPTAPLPLNILALACFNTGDRFIQRARERGAKVWLLTKETYLRKKRWRRDLLEDVFAEPDDASLVHTVNTVSYLARTIKFDRIIPFDAVDVEAAHRGVRDGYPEDRERRGAVASHRAARRPRLPLPARAVPARGRAPRGRDRRRGQGRVRRGAQKRAAALRGRARRRRVQLVDRGAGLGRLARARDAEREGAHALRSAARRR